MQLTEIRNYVQLTPNIATSGQPDARQFEAIAGAGYSTVINLAMPDSDFALDDEGRLVTSAGMNYVHIPVPFAAPTPRHLRLFIGVMALLSDQKVWVHCALNYRVAAFMNRYQALGDNIPPQVGRSTMLSRWRADATWQRFMQLSKEDLYRD